MTTTHRARTAWRRLVPVLALAGVLGVHAADAAQSLRSQDPALQAARVAYDATDYEGARTQLDTIVAQLTGQPLTPATRDVLAAAYELRGRTLQNLREVDAARDDFRLMLLLRPDYPFPAEAGARAMALFEEVRAVTVGLLEIDAAPADARIVVDGQPVEPPARVWLAEGMHTVTAERRGFAPASEAVTVTPGAPNRVQLALARISSALAVATVPGGVEVLVNGVSRGRTSGAPGAASLSPDAPGFRAEDTPSAPLVIEDLPLGTHVIETRRDCYVTERRTVEIPRHDDIRLEPLKLQPAVGTITVRSDRERATVYVNGLERGPAPQTITACEGTRVIDVRTPRGRDVRRYDLKTGAKEVFEARIRPAVALFSDGTVTAAQLLDVERAFAAATSMKLFVARDEGANGASGAAASAPSLALDLGAQADAAASAVARRERVTAAIDRASAQGAAAVVRVRDEMRLLLFAPGSAEPDVLTWRAGDAAGERDAVARLDTRLPLLRPWFGLTAIDVLDVQGIVVVAVEPGGPAALAGVQRGDTLVSAGGSPISSVAAFEGLAAAQPAERPLAIEVRNAAGTVRAVTVTPARQPLVADPLDRTGLSNARLIDLTFRTPDAASPLEREAMRLNRAAAWMQVEAWPEAAIALEEVLASARAELSGPQGEAVVATAQYLLGAAAARRGDTATARRAWTEASTSSVDLLSGGTMSVQELAARGLRTLPPP